MQSQSLAKAFRILMILVLAVVILVYAKPFLVPMVFAGLFAMLLLPMNRWLERKGVHKVIAIILSILVLLAFFGGLIAFISWQVSDLAGDTGKMEQQLNQQGQKLRTYISNSLGIPPQEQEKMMQQQKASSTGKTSNFINGLVTGIGT